MNTLLISDTHFSPKGIDQVRLRLLDDIANKASNGDVDAVIHAGDLTDFKDRHPSTLVNDIVDGLMRIAEHCPVFILKGNHDYLNEDRPFFDFLNYMDNIHFLCDPLEQKIGGKRFLMLPHTRDPHSQGWDTRDYSVYDYVVIHTSFDGSVSESGVELDGVSKEWFESANMVLAGDIHKPQVVADNILHIGSPYHTRFGDNFEPRYLAIQDEGVVECSTDFPKRITATIDDVSEIKDLESKEGDYVKIRVRIEESDPWAQIRNQVHTACESLGLIVAGVEPERSKKQQEGKQMQFESSLMKRLDDKQVVDYVADKESVDKSTARAGKRILNQVKGEG